MIRFFKRKRKRSDDNVKPFIYLFIYFSLGQNKDSDRRSNLKSFLRRGKITGNIWETIRRFWFKMLRKKLEVWDK